MARVYNIGEFKVEVKQDYKGITYEGDKQCHHRNLTFDEAGQTIVCDDCELQVTAWWAFLNLVHQYQTLKQNLDHQREQLEADKARNLTHKSAIAVEDAWRRRKMTPCCPHCSKPILAGDKFGSGLSVNKDLYKDQAKPMAFRGQLSLVKEEA